MKKIKEYILNLNYTQISLIIAYIINMLVPHEDLLNMTSGSSILDWININSFIFII